MSRCLKGSWVAAQLLLLFTSASFADTYPRQPIDVIHYKFALTLSDATDEIGGEATVDVRFLVAGTTSFMLDLASPSMAVNGVSTNDESHIYTHTGNRLTITLGNPPVMGERRQFRIVYRGVPTGGLRIIKNKYNERTFFSENWPNQARQWLPMIDHPYDKATSEFLITAPAHYQVIANGLLIEETDLGDGRRLTHWKQSVPIASWLNAIGVAQFSVRQFGVAKGIPLSTWVYHQDRHQGIATFDLPTRQAMEFFSDYVGPFSYEKLANVVAAGLNGGTEHASAIFYGEKSVSDKPATRLVYHEIAHQWFGDAITEKDWDEVWLSEGFATYFTLLGVEHYEGRDAFLAGIQRSRAGIIELEVKLPNTPVIHNNLSDMKKVLNRLIYEKGGWTLHMLRRQMGDEKFQAGIRDYYQRYRDGNNTTAEFRQVMEDHSGLKLARFFDQWLKRAGVPQVTGSWSYNAAAKKIFVDLAQTQDGDSYLLPLQFGIDGEKVVEVVMTSKSQHVEIPVESAPKSLVLDPNVNTLMQAKFGPR